MDIRNDFHVLCERFFHLEMDELETNEFVRQLELNPDLKSQFEAEAKIHSLLEEPTITENDPDLEESRDALQFLEKALREANTYRLKPSTEVKDPIVISWAPLVAAAASIIIISIIIFNNYKTATTDSGFTGIDFPPRIDSIIQIPSDSLFRENYTAYTFAEEVPIELENAFLLYNKKEYIRSLKELDAYSGSRSGFEGRELEFRRQFGIGLCKLQLNNAAEAIKALENSSQSKSNSIKNASYWYLGLAYLREKMLEEAALNFSKVMDESSYKTKAKKLENILNGKKNNETRE